MEKVIAIDTSAIIWDNNDFGQNTHHYYNLLKGLGVFLEEIPKLDIKILLRNELQREMFNGIPFSELPKDYYDVIQTFYSFFDKVSGMVVNYHNSTISNLTSIPNQIKEHFNQNTKNEVGYLLSKIHSDNNVSYFTFEYLWDNNDDLKTEVNGEEKEHTTVISDKNYQLQQFIDNITPRFEHNPKHNVLQYHSKEYWLNNPDQRNNFVSQLSCYNGNDTKEPQKILNERYPRLINDCYYGWDNKNEVFVVFRKTNDNIFHAYDEYNLNQIPTEVKKHFNIWKYKWYH